MKTKTFVAFGCSHNPLINKKAEDNLIKVIAETDPDYVICLGDLHEADSASRWPSEYTFTLEDELADVDRFLERIRYASPRSEHIFIEGNHDANIIALNRVSKKIRGLVDYRRRQYDKDGLIINHEFIFHWKCMGRYIYDPKHVFRLGQVGFIHGFETSNAGIKRQAVTLSHEYGLLIHAHTHRPTENAERVYMGTSTPLNYWYADTGCLRNLKPPFVERRNTSRWGHGCIRGEVIITKSPRYRRLWEIENIKL